jgi:gamma-glutamylcyclotransferase (GGCT)/AIG2-like uncharacterized protein YtfP
MNSQATTQPLPFFVYGTLMIGQPNETKWQDCVQRFEKASIDNCRLFDVGHYPMMLIGKGGKVFGQLVRLRNECYSHILQELDFLEGFDPNHPKDSNFLRVRAQIKTHAGEKLEAWTYVGVETTARNLPLIEHGDWAKHVAGANEIISIWWKEVNSVWDDSRYSNDSEA